MNSVGVVAVVAARDEEDRIAATVAGIRSIPDVGRVIVVDDGSRDATASAARAAGAEVLALPRDAGKGPAVEEGLRFIGGGAGPVLLADGDLGETASRLSALIHPVLEGRADMAVAALPPQGGGGLGHVKRLARWCIRRSSGFEATEPLSGQRVLAPEVVAACRPLARGFGLETALTIDAARLGFRVVEVPVDLTHRPTGRDLRGFLHRGRQGWDILRAVVPRFLGMR